MTDRVGPGLLDDLRSRLRGPVLAPGDEGYDPARAAWNRNAQHRPAVVVQAADAARRGRRASGSGCWPPATEPAGRATAAC